MVDAVPATEEWSVRASRGQRAAQSLIGVVGVAVAVFVVVIERHLAVWLPIVTFCAIALPFGLGIANVLRQHIDLTSTSLSFLKVFRRHVVDLSEIREVIISGVRGPLFSGFTVELKLNHGTWSSVMLPAIMTSKKNDPRLTAVADSIRRAVASQSARNPSTP